MAAVDQRPPKRRRLDNKKTKDPKKDFPSGDDVLRKDIELLQSTLSVADYGVDSLDAAPEKFSEVKVTIKSLTCSGEGLGVSSGSQYIFCVPFTCVGDRVLAKAIRANVDQKYVVADFIKVLDGQGGDLRDESHIFCQYFAKCAGCQLQMLPYNEQTSFKRTTVERAYKYFSHLDPSLVPKVEETMCSPLQKEYRTKLTPHFDGPPGHRHHSRGGRGGATPRFTSVPPIGFQMKGMRRVLDIEDCPLGTKSVRMGLKLERERVARELDSFGSGATLLLRENTIVAPSNHRKLPLDDSEGVKITDEDVASTATSIRKVILEDGTTVTQTKNCITNSKAEATEYIGEYTVANTAGSFFQNNNSILEPFLEYIRSVIKSSTTNWTTRYLIDAYSGSGMFTITLSSLFKSSIAVDVDERAVESARKNAVANSIPEGQAKFMSADATELFKEIEFPAAETVIVVDPPRKGCSEDFIKQLVKLGPAVVVYVSCNVHSQARDVGEIVRSGGYRIESLKGFDFFPQTSHVEGVAVLTKPREETQA